MVNDTNTALRHQITLELRNGEELLWAGKPAPVRVVLANGELISRIIGVIIIGAVAIFLSNFRMPSNFSSITILRWLPLFAVMLAVLILARPVYEFIIALRTVYGITNQRVLIIKQTFTGKKVESYTDSSGIERTDTAANTGDLVFGRQYSTYRSNGRSRTRTHKIGFFGIPNINQVEALMLNVFNGRTANFDF